MTTALQATKVTRNGVDITFDPVKYKKGKERKDRLYLGIDNIKDEDLPNIITWIGPELKDVIKKFMSQTCQAASQDAGEDDDDNPKDFDYQTFVTDMQELAVSSDTLEDMKTEKDEYLNQMTELFAVMNSADATPEKIVESQKEGYAISQKIKNLNSRIEKRSRKKKNVVAEGAAVPA